MYNEDYAVYNPQEKPIESLPVIYGFNNGGARDNWYGVLLAQDGVYLGNHLCSAEYFMLGDLGILKGSRADRHIRFKKHYPDGYRMDFVSRSDVRTHPGLMEAIKLNLEQMDKEEL